MYKPSLNPTVKDLTLSWRKRRYNTSDLDAPVIEGRKCCAWCLTPLSGRKYRWCSNSCGEMAFAWANPQSSEGLAYLLARQGYRCAGCILDWNPIATSLIGKHGIRKDHNPLKTVSGRFVKMIKNRSPEGTKPEVDHIVPIYKGGASLGLDNHQALCYSCHKVKSKVDNSGPRAKIKK